MYFCYDLLYPLCDLFLFEFSYDFECKPPNGLCLEKQNTIRTSTTAANDNKPHLNSNLYLI